MKTVHGGAVAQRAEIICADFETVLSDRVRPGDFVFLDPPYMPIGKWGDFKRYTKEQFGDEDHRRLSRSLHELARKDIWAVLTNSNHQLVHELFGDFKIEVVPTKRNISSDGKMRTGEDAIIDVVPKRAVVAEFYTKAKVPQQVKLYPQTRYMGSKRKLLDEIWTVAERFNFDSAVDLFSGSGVVSYLFKCMGKSVVSNDYMSMSAVMAKAMIENNSVTLGEDEAVALLCDRSKGDGFVARTFKGLFFSDEDNKTIDILRANINAMRNPFKRAIAKSALIRACAKKRRDFSHMSGTDMMMGGRICVCRSPICS